MIPILRNRYVDSRYALREELDEVRDDVKGIKADTVELKSVMNFIKWLIVATVPITAIITNFGEGVREQLDGPMPVKEQKVEIFETSDGQKYLLEQKTGEAIPIKE